MTTQAIIMAARSVFAIAALLGATTFGYAESEKPSNFCTGSRGDVAARPIPPALAPVVMKAFDIDRAGAASAGFYRCDGGRLLVCYVGANLPCGKANVSRSLPAADKYCRDNPNESFVPMYATGHDTIYSWRCAGKVARPGPPVESVDKRGYFSRYWKRP
jgi:hypothetical protein